MALICMALTVSQQGGHPYFQSSQESTTCKQVQRPLTSTGVGLLSWLPSRSRHLWPVPRPHVWTSPWGRVFCPGSEAVSGGWARDQQLKDPCPTCGCGTGTPGGLVKTHLTGPTFMAFDSAGLLTSFPMTPPPRVLERTLRIAGLLSRSAN